MRLASRCGMRPARDRRASRRGARERAGDGAERVEVAGPGFLNLFLPIAGTARRWPDPRPPSAPRSPGAELAERVLSSSSPRIPTGPLTAAGGRGAAYGDSLARVLDAAGHEVGREYYLNDGGTQIARFAASIAARMRGEPSRPRTATQASTSPNSPTSSRRRGRRRRSGRPGAARAEAMRQRIEATLERFGVHFDTWFSERELLRARCAGGGARGARRRRSHLRREGAVWLRTTEFGDDKDRVLVRSDGEPTYFAADIAYHRDKLERGGRADDRPARRRPPRLRAADEGGDRGARRRSGPLRGADHAARPLRRGRRARPDVEAQGRVRDPRRADRRHRRGRGPLLHDAAQPRHGARPRPRSRARASPRTTRSTTCSTRTPGSPASCARRRPREGRRRAGESIVGAATTRCRWPRPASRPSARWCAGCSSYPDEVAQAAEKRAPHRLTAYAMAAAADFHAFYRDCQVVGADAEAGIEGLEAARLGVCLAAKRVIAGTLDLLGDQRRRNACSSWRTHGIRMGNRRRALLSCAPFRPRRRISK